MHVLKGSKALHVDGRSGFLFWSDLRASVSVNDLHEDILVLFEAGIFWSSLKLSTSQVLDFYRATEVLSMLLQWYSIKPQNWQP